MSLLTKNNYYIFILAILISCKSDTNKVIKSYEKFIIELEKRQINKEKIPIDFVNNKRDSILLLLKDKKLNKNEIEWLNALNSRFDMIILNEKNKFPAETIPDYMKRILNLPDNRIENITTQNLAKMYSNLLDSLRAKKINKDDALKTYKFLERYHTLYNDNLSDSSIISIEKNMIEIEKLLEE